MKFLILKAFGKQKGIKMEHPPKDFEAIVAKINEALPLHSMWDGFWVHSFKQKTLIVSCSFTNIYYRNFDIVFKDVTFFNLPETWRDTEIEGEDLLRIASNAEFERQQPDLDPKAHLIFAIDIWFRDHFPVQERTYYLVAKHVYLNECHAPDNHPSPLYADPFENEAFPCFKNRVGNFPK